MFKVGDRVSGMYDSGKNGTVLNPNGVVRAVAPRLDQGARVTVEFPGGRFEEYIVGKTGKCDYLMPSTGVTVG